MLALDTFSATSAGYSLESRAELHTQSGDFQRMTSESLDTPKTIIHPN